MRIDIIKYLAFVFFLFSVKLFGQNVFGQTTKNETFIGYYKVGWENSSFWQIKESKLLRPIWLSFDSTFVHSDTLKILLNKNLLSKGVLIELQGKLLTGGTYGHLGAASSEIIVTRLLSIDTTMTLDVFFNNKK